MKPISMVVVMTAQWRGSDFPPAGLRAKTGLGAIACTCRAIRGTHVLADYFGVKPKDAL
jgi:hypothetical protein